MIIMYTTTNTYLVLKIMLRILVTNGHRVAVSTFTNGTYVRYVCKHTIGLAIQLNLKKYFEEKAPEMFGQIALAFWHLFFGLWYYTLSKTLSSLVERIVVEGRRSYSCPIWSLCSEGSLIALKTA